MGIQTSEKAEMIHRVLVDAMNEGAITLTSSGDVTFCNEVFSKMVKMPQAEIVDSQWKHFFPAYEHIGLERLIRKAKQGGCKAEFTLLRGDDTRVTVELSVRSLRVEDQEIFFVVITDIAERKRQEFALWESEQRFRLLVDQARDYAIIILDPNGRITHWNAGAQRLNGFTGEEILGECFERFYLQEEVEKEIPWKGLEKAKTEGRYESEGWRMRKDGSCFWANVVLTALHDKAGNLVGFSKLIRDITERKRVRDALHQKTTELEESQRLVKVGSWEWFPETDTAQWSKELYQIMDRDPEQPAYVRKDLPDLFPPDSLSRFEEALQHTLDTGQNFEVDVELKHPDRTNRWITFRGAVGARDQDGKITKLRGTVQDITERKRMENSLRDSDRFVHEVLDTIASQICVLDETGKIIATNKAWHEFARKKNASATFEGENYLEICDRVQGAEQPAAAAFAAGLRAVLKGEKQTYSQEYACPNPQEKNWFKAFVSRFAQDGPTRLVVVHENITSTKTVEALRSGEARVLEMIANRAPLESILTNLVQMIEEQAPGMICSVMLADEEEKHLRLAAAPNLPEAYKQSIAIFEIGPAVGSCGTAAFRKEPVFVTDMLTDPLWEPYRQIFISHNLQACWSTPILSQDKLLGTFGMYYPLPRGPEDSELQLIDVATHIAKIAITQQLAEEKLQQSEQRFRNAFAGAAVGLILLDMKGNFREANQAYRILTGYSSEELMGMKINALIHPEDVPRTQELMGKLLAGEIPSFILQKRLQTKNGSFVWTQNSVSLLLDAQGRPMNILVITEDIRKRKEAEEVLKQSEQDLRLFIKSAPVAIAIFDREMRYRAASERWLEFFDLHGDVTGLCHYAVFPNLPERWKQVHQRALAGAVERDEADAYIDSTGSTRWVMWEVRPWRSNNAEVAGISIVIEDITQRKAAEEELRRSGERFRNMAELVPGIIYTCLPNGQTEYFNRWFYDYTGRPEGSLLGSDWMELVHEEDKSFVTEHHRRFIENEEPYQMHFRLRSGSGEFRWFLTRTRPIRDAEGHIVQWQGIGTDIEEQKRAEEVLEKRIAQRTAKLQETVNELEQYSYSITHDLRAPLRAIQGFASLLKDENEALLPPAAHENLRKIMSSAERMENLIRDSLNYGKLLLGDVPMEPVNITDLTLDIIQSYPSLQIPQAHIRFEGEIPVVMGNPAGLAQCVSNLLRNAVKFVAPGVIPSVRIRAEHKDGLVRIWFEDNGIGIAQEAQDQIFGMFQQLNKQFEGTGIGLTIVRKAVERMGGKVGVESELGRGSRFWIELRKAF